MSSARVTIDEATPAVDGWTELASRENDGLEIRLLWSRSGEQVKVAVRDERRGESFDLDIARADALSAFHHPFAYAAGRGLRFGSAMRASLDLQPQD